MSEDRSTPFGVANIKPKFQRESERACGLEEVEQRRLDGEEASAKLLERLKRFHPERDPENNPENDPESQQCDG